VRALAAAITGFINVLDPELVVIGGGIADADEVLFNPLQAELDRFEWRPDGTRVRVVKPPWAAMRAPPGRRMARNWQRYEKLNPNPKLQIPNPNKTPNSNV